MRIAASGGGSCCCIFLRQRIISKGSDMLDETMAHYHERQGGKRKSTNIASVLICFGEPLVGFEPTTPRLQITCSGQLS